MLVGFFLHLRACRLPVGTREFLTLVEALDRRVVSCSLDDFYALARTTLVKDEQLYDRFDAAFAACFDGVDALFDAALRVPDEWLRGEIARHLGDAARSASDEAGALERLLDRLRERAAEQRERHRGGSKWIGTGGTSPFGAHGMHSGGIRIGPDRGTGRASVRLWDGRPWRDLDGGVELDTRNLRVALRRLRRLARDGAPEELDLDETIAGTAKNAGWLDLRLRPERRNGVKLLLFLDVGGSMDPHIEVCEELFFAARSEFRHLESFYFHNCIYDHVWPDDARRRGDRQSTFDLLRRCGPEWKVVIVGDAAMSPYELTAIDGSAEYRNLEPGLAWLARIFDHFRKVVWWNPEPERSWSETRSTQMIAAALGPRMYPLTLDGVSAGIAALRH